MPLSFDHASSRKACRLGTQVDRLTAVRRRREAGRSPQWLKIKYPAAPAVTREAEEDWGR
jgi:hypothetical protein